MTATLWGPARVYAQMGAQARRSMGQAASSVSPETAAAFGLLSDLAWKIKNERALDAGDFRDYSAAGAQRLALVDALGKAERALSEQQRIWESNHRNADAVAGAQAQVDLLNTQIADAAAKANDLRLSIDAHAARIETFRDKATQIIASLPAESQLEGRRIIDPCAQTATLQGRAAPRRSAPVLAPALPPFMNPARPREVTLLGAYRPAYAAPSPIRATAARGGRLGQLVTVNPNVSVNVQTGLEKYLFPVGLMAAGGASFIVGTVIPPSLKVVTTLSGLGLIGWGVFVLIKGGTSGGAAGAAPAATPPPPTGATPIEASPQPFVPPSVPAFNMVQIEMVSPIDNATIGSVGTFLGIGTPKIPIMLRLYNPTPEAVTFNLEFEWDEFATVADFNRAPQHGTQVFQVSLGPNEEKNQEFDLVIKTGGYSSSISIALSLFKKRVPNENHWLVMTKTFTVT
jgi:hypothetical protein